ncbi:MAG: hypothetical protein F4Y45_18260 [Acidobacteria bacterium]|nr:hypothetical protein [Acidobacteriota bacterium]MYJ05295.1 hypothetical protein [Acidobacteriota bacterium]
MTVRGFVVACMLIGLTVGASTATAQGGYEPPRLPDGKPDLQGVWDFRTLTPLQRPQDQESAILTEEEAAEIEARSAERSAELNAPTERTGELLPVGGNVGGYNHYWVDQGASVVGDQRTSLIMDPPSGRLPELQPGFELVELSLAEDRPGTRPVRVRAAGIGADSYEDRGLAERCLLGFNSGPPIVPAGYNQNLQIFQTPDHVVILHEMVHDARIVPLDGRDHLPEGVRQWMGDSRGYWDGDTLVVESRNFTEKVASFNPSVATSIGEGDTLHLTERFSLVGDDTLLYEFTVNDPTTFTAPFTAALPMKRGEGMFEYACHEGNYGLFNILSGARAAEEVAADSQP